jgi:tRNA dimethylallyltransferase
MSEYDLITILGPTASGKTNFAAQLASVLDTEIISADSRQVYRGMDIGTGKDLSDYRADNKQIKCHLIDIYDAGEKYNVYEYQHDFHQAYQTIKQSNKLPILCGGTGLYIESVLKGFRLLNVPENKELRANLANKNLEELKLILSSLTELHNVSDFDSKKRAIRAIEIADYQQSMPVEYHDFEPLNSLIIGLNIDRDLRRKKISQRLQSRIDEGMIDEVKSLIDSGVPAENLIYYGLEYKFITQYILGELDYETMFSQLEIAIHQFAKRQMTWFRGMEKRGFKIHWIDVNIPNNEKIQIVAELL